MINPSICYNRPCLPGPARYRRTFSQGVLRPGLVLNGVMVGPQVARTQLSAVFLGWDTHDRRVAIKLLAPDTAHLADGENLARLVRREARVLARLRHPGIPRLLAAGKYAGQPYLIMEYIEGVSLEDRLANGPLGQDEALAIFYELCQVVAYLHCQALPIIHADIKPGNIRIDRDGRVVLLDFGLAHPRDREQAWHFRMGTPPYAPPEQHRGEPLDERSDIYALGWVLHELFGAPHSGPVAAIVGRATAERRADRYRSIAALWGALEAELLPPPAVAPTPRLGGAWLLGAVLVGMMLLAGLLALVV